MMNRFLLILSLVIASGFMTEAGTETLMPLHTMVIISAPVLEVQPAPDPAGVLMESLSSTGERDFQVQLGAFQSETNALRYLSKMQSYFGGDVLMIEENGFYKVRLADSSERNSKVLYYDPESMISNSPEIPQEEMILLTNYTIENKTEIQDAIQVTELPKDTSLIYGNTTDTLTVPGGLTDTINPAGIIYVQRPEDSTAESKDIAAENPEPKKHRFLILNSESPWLKRINYFGKSFALVNALIVTIILSIATMIVLLILILLNRTRMEKEEKLRQYLSEKYQTLIIDYLFGDATPEKFFSIASNTYRRQVLIDQMIDVSVNLKGDAEQKLRALYLDLGLDNDSIKRANDSRWHKKIKGFRELAFMNIKDANPAIIKALDSKNEILRMEAQIALVRLSDDDPFGFLSSLNRPFSLWEQITLHELIIQHDIPVPAFKKWLTSSNPTVVMFALRMIREFKQTDAEEEVRETLFYPSPEVRLLAVQVAGDLNMRSTLDIMKSMYKNQDYHTCLEIIKSMGKMPDTAYMGFLKLVLDKEDDVQLQIEATKAMENMGEEGVKALVKLMKSEYKNYNIIVRHVLDRRIF
ncbi:MAG: HEAT repeat domain-containing protein [Bacteroidales bacterium]|jgi:HEAT repeat protein|nr:HEAT repeat domain-containing protein [Bacteroidales bacterium]